MSIFNSNFRPFARERIQITNGGVKTLTTTVFNDNANGGPIPNQQGDRRRHALGAKIVLDSGSGQIHYTEEGTVPTVAIDNTGVGSIASAGDVIWLESYEAINKFKSIALTAANAQGEVVYYR